jgi:hypothetical protein
VHLSLAIEIKSPETVVELLKPIETAAFGDQAWAEGAKALAMRVLTAAALAQDETAALKQLSASIPAAPAAAIHWAITLPAGKERDDTLDKIYHNWPTQDPAGKAAAAAFEKEYNIQHHH